MLLGSLVFLQLLSLGLSAPSNSVPSFLLLEERSMNGAPKVEVTFPNGEVDTLLLKEFFSNGKDRKESCNFVGHLEKETEACVALTGCIGGPMELTILSKNTDFMSTYLWTENGDVEEIEHPFKDGLAWTERSYDRDEEHEVGDEDLNDQQEFEEAKIEAKCENEGGCEKMPTTMLLKLKVAYSSNFLAKFDQSHELARDYIEATLAHTQAHYCHESLGTAIKIERVDDFQFLDQRINASSSDLKGLNSYVTENLDDASLIAVFGADEEYRGVVGRANVGGVCQKKRRAKSINEWRNKVSKMARVLSHEMGHNLGMKHDFDEYHGGMEGKCVMEGIMSYGKVPQRWSECSKADFQAHYLKQKEVWCMDEALDACKM